jgi:hypothetical protein
MSLYYTFTSAYHLQKIYHYVNYHYFMVAFSCVYSSCVYSNCWETWSTGHTPHSGKVSHLCGSFYGSSEQLNLNSVHHTHHMHMASPLCVVVNVGSSRFCQLTASHSSYICSKNIQQMIICEQELNYIKLQTPPRSCIYSKSIQYNIMYNKY